MASAARKSGHPEAEQPGGWTSGWTHTQYKREISAKAHRGLVTNAEESGFTQEP